MNTDSFFSVLQVAIGTKTVGEVCLDEKALAEAFACARKHSLIGVFYHALLLLKESGYAVDNNLFLRAYALTEKLKQKNEELDEDCATITAKFREAGFESCILKGQGLALLYPCTLVRNPGDADVWVMPHEKGLSLSQRREKIYRYCSSLVGKTHIVYHHMVFPVRKNDVEVHFTPSWMFSPFANRNLQKFFEGQWEGRTLTDKGFYVPSAEFNLVYILVHIYRHLFDEGIGLRQCLDYYWVLQRSLGEASSAEGLKDRTRDVLRSLGMERFAMAMMYVLQMVFGLDAKYMLCEPEEEAGEFVLSEIMIGGNFGFYDDRYGKKGDNGLTNLYVQVRHNFKFLRYFPGETLWTVPFRIWHYCWRKSKGWR